MSIRPPSDIVLDVARNAAAELAASATRRLDSLTSIKTAEVQSFGSALESVSPKPSQGADSKFRTLRVASRPQAVSSGSEREKEVGLQFEASVLSAFVNDAMPKNMSSYYGQGASGEIWKSMLSDQIAHQLAKSGSLGIARRLFATHPLNQAAGPSALAAAVDRGLQDVAQSSGLPLSAPRSLGLGVGATVLAGRRRS
jgi:flagellar protein FlgJ